MTALTPDLWAARNAARELQDDAQHGAAWFLARPEPDIELATQFAWAARAAAYEAMNLAREAWAVTR